MINNFFLTKKSNPGFIVFGQGLAKNDHIKNKVDNKKHQVTKNKVDSIVAAQHDICKQYRQVNKEFQKRHDQICSYELIWVSGRNGYQP